MLAFVNDTDTNISRWDAIVRGQLEKGMSKTDVYLVLGKPIDTQTSGDTTQFMYNQFTYVFFENGTVKSFMQ